jgi:hypothetical protein
MADELTRPDGWYCVRVNESPWRVEFIRANSSDHLYYTEIGPRIPMPDEQPAAASRPEALKIMPAEEIERIRAQCQECLNDRIEFNGNDTTPIMECDHCRDKLNLIQAITALEGEVVRLGELLNLNVDSYVALEAEVARLREARHRITDLERERAELWDQRDTAYHAWQPLTQWDNLRKERDEARRELSTVRTQTIEVGGDAVLHIRDLTQERDKLRKLLREAWGLLPGDTSYLWADLRKRIAEALGPDKEGTEV